MSISLRQVQPTGRRVGIGFWIVAIACAIVMMGATLPIMLYALGTVIFEAGV